MDGPQHSDPTGKSFPAWLRMAGCAFRAHQLVRSRLQSVAKEEGLHAVEALLLICCKTAPQGIAQQDLVAFSGYSAALISTRVDTLHQQGLVHSRRDPRDRRRQLWLIAAPGQEIASRLVERISRADHLQNLHTCFANLANSICVLSRAVADKESGQGAAA